MTMNSQNLTLDWKPAELRQYLVVIRCGANLPSVNLEKLRNNPKIDILFSFYEEPQFEYRFENAFAFKGGLSKYHAFQVAWDSYPALHNYKAYWLLDADIEFDTTNLNALIEEGLSEQLDVWQPSLSTHSYSRWLHLRNDKHRVGIRRVNFVEVMAPIFSNAGLKKCLRTFSEAVSTWGLDFAWTRLADPDCLGVSDTFEMCHPDVPDTKNGAFYRYLRSIGVNPYWDNFRMRLKYRTALLRPGNNTVFYVREWLATLRSTDRLLRFDRGLWFIESDTCTPVFFLNHHSLYTLATHCISPPSSSIGFADGMLMARQLRLANGRWSFDFTGGASHVVQKCADHGIPITFIGGEASQSKMFRERITSLYPSLRFSVHHGYRTDDQIEEICSNSEFGDQPHIVVLGLGTPRQELLAVRLSSRQHGHTRAIFTCGGFISQTSRSRDGHYYPAIVDKLHLRWAWRLIKERQVLKRLLTSYISCTLLLAKASEVK